MEQNRRVVITGLGAVSPLGNDTATTWQGLKTGQNGLSPIEGFVVGEQKNRLAGLVKINAADYLAASETRKMDRFTMLAVVAAMEALADSGITADNCDLNRAAVVVATGIGGLPTIEKEFAKGTEKGFERISALFIPMSIANMAAGRIAIMSGFKNYCYAPVTACAGGTNALGDALRMIRHGYADIALSGGAEGCISPLTVGGFASMKALSESEDPNRASIPFDAERSGFIIGEGAGILMLEELEHAKKRGAKIYGEITGYGVSCDAYHITAPEPNSLGGIAAMANALADAKLKAEAIDYINAHGTSTPLNDKGETLAIKQVFGEHSRKLAVSSTKSMMGHALGAAGALEAIACIKAINDSYAPPTINYKVADPECDLDYIPNQGRAMQIKHALSNSLGFGGHNATIILSAYQEA